MFLSVYSRFSSRMSVWKSENPLDSSSSSSSGFYITLERNFRPDCLQSL